MHCIGDRANRVVLDAMELALTKYGPADRRLRIEHAQIMTEDDLARAVRLGGESCCFNLACRVNNVDLVAFDSFSHW